MAVEWPDTWTYSDWITQSTDALRLSRLNLHIQEVADALKPGTFKINGQDVHVEPIQKYLEGLYVRQAQLQARVDVANGTRLGWTRAKGKLL